MTRSLYRLTLALALACGASAMTAGCGLLDTSDPTAVSEDELANAAGANLMRRNALVRLYTTMGYATMQSGLMADEFFSDPEPSTLASYIPEDMQLDQREQTDENAAYNFYYYGNAARRNAGEAAAQLAQYATSETKNPYVGEMHVVRGFVTVLMAEVFCPGFPLNEVIDGKVVYSPAMSSTDAFEHALSQFDSAIALSADSARILDMARVGRARALIGLGRFAEAGVTASAVAPGFSWNMEYTDANYEQPNSLAFLDTYMRKGVSDNEGGVGLDFVSAADQRVELRENGTTYNGLTTLYALTKYPDESSPIVLASGIEAQLIVAEAQLAAGDAGWLGTLNALRASATPALAPLADPGTPDSRLDLVFRERAFWLFATAHRLGDMRRLVSVYGREPEAVFPSGPYRVRDFYGTHTSIAFPLSYESQNPNVTGCTDR